MPYPVEYRLIAIATAVIDRTDQIANWGWCSRTLSRDYRSILKRHVIPFFGVALIADITSDDLAEFRDWLVGKGLAASTIRHAMVFVRNVLEFAAIAGLIDALPKMEGATPILSRKDANVSRSARRAA